MSVNAQMIPKVSVGLPVFNGEKYLAEALGSLLRQKFKDFELIVCDNASEDRTEDICRGFEKAFDGRMRYLRHGKNLGIMANFRHVFEAAKGEYFMWAACDDLWDDRWLLNMVSIIESPDVDIAFGKVTHINSSGNPVRHPANNASFCYKGPVMLRRLRFYLDYEGLGKANVIYGLFKRRLFPAISSALGDLESGRMRYDFNFVFCLLKEGKLGRDRTVAMKKRIRHDSSGEEMGRRLVTESFTKKLFRRVFNPFPEGLLAEYLYFSSPAERVLLLLFFPVKLLMAYWAQTLSLLFYSRR